MVEADKKDFAVTITAMLETFGQEGNSGSVAGLLARASGLGSRGGSAGCCDVDRHVVSVAGSGRGSASVSRRIDGGSGDRGLV